MDHIREELDQLMGKDRNHPLHIRLQMRDHFDDEDVCKFNLLGFCPNNLFPNTKHDQGPCQKRHDDFFKEIFLVDQERKEYEKKYESELIEYLTKMISNVDSKIKKSLARAENPVQGNNRIERQQIEQASVLQRKLLEDPALLINKQTNQDSSQYKAPELSQAQKEQVYQRIEQLEQKIDFFITNAQKQGEEGNIEESEAIMLEVDKVRIQKQELQDKLLGKSKFGNDFFKTSEGFQSAAYDIDNPFLGNQMMQGKPDRNMKVCEICGALQSMADTDERLRMHLEGKLHQGYQKIREKLQELKRKKILDKQNGYDRQNFQKNSLNKDRKKIDLFLSSEAKLRFYYSSNKWGNGVNMPKLNSINDQSFVRFSDQVMQRNMQNEGDLPKMQDTNTLGREWRYYKKDIDQAKRIKKKQDEKKAEMEKRNAGKSAYGDYQQNRDHQESQSSYRNFKGGIGSRNDINQGQQHLGKRFSKAW